MEQAEDLRKTLHRLDGRGYKAYKDIKGSYSFGDFSLIVDHVQGDPFAAPSRLRVRVDPGTGAYPASTYDRPSRRRALATYLAGEFGRAAAGAQLERTGSGKSGQIEIDMPGQQILERTCIQIDAGLVEARFTVGLPAAGRRILGTAAAQLLCDRVPDIVRTSLRYRSNDADLIERYIQTGEDAESLRQQLAGSGLVAFVGDGSILPRRSGIDDCPLTDGGGPVVPFQSPTSLRAEFELPHAGLVRGLGIPSGVTLMVGGGFHGKSTLLRAIERGVYDHVPGDGRERVVTDPSAVKIRAEDGRAVAGVDISAFVRDLPFGGSTDCFTTQDASGSTSQAANISEALECDCRLLLLDEDTSATNFMIRDARMQQLVSAEQEPIVPFVDRVRQLYQERDVSTILVMGGSGDYFAVADTVIGMEQYTARDLTEPALAIAAASAYPRVIEHSGPLGSTCERTPIRQSIDPRRGRREVEVVARGRRTIQFGTQTIDLSAVEQLVDSSQTRALAAAMVYARNRYMDESATVRQILDRVLADIDSAGLDALEESPLGDRAAFRAHELAAAINRLRTLQVEQVPH